MSTAPTPRRRRARFDLASYESALVAFSAELGSALEAGLSGRAAAIELASVYDSHGDLFSPDAIDALRRLAGGEGDEARRARRLTAFAVDGHVGRAVAGLTERIAAAERDAVIVWRGERIAYRAARIRVAQLSARAERNGLDAAYREAVEAINPLRVERAERMSAVVRELGYPDVVALVRETRGYDPAQLAGQLQRFLVESETPYYAALRRYLAEIDIEGGDGTAADVSYLLRGSGWDAWFQPQRLLSVVRTTFAGLGIDLGAQSNITLDIESRAAKVPRAHCIPIRIPQDVRLVVQPRGGYHDYATVLHELGHAEHYAGTDPDLPAAYRYVGDESVTEAYAFLVEHLTLEPGWLAEHLAMPDDEIAAFLDFATFRRLYLFRRDVAKLLYELRLHQTDDVAVQRAYYAGLLGSITGVQTPEASWLSDTDDHLYSARYLRAWMLEGSLRASLAAVGGESWWRTTEAGDALRAAWGRGQEQRAEDVVARLGYDQLDWRPVLRQIRTRLIGEMSGYGGPNITTRAGTRKV